METSYLLARVIGPYLLIVGLGLLVSRERYVELIDHYPENKTVIVGFGAIALLAGLMLLQFHNLWTADWRVLITVFGWFATLKGATALMFPDALTNLSKGYRGNPTLLNINAAITALFGAILIYMGYFG